MDRTDVVIVGGGLSGLVCGVELESRGLSVQVLEASDGVGGRVRTDRVDGFLLDRGFQVFLTAYPEAGRVLDLDALDLQPFDPGARIRLEDGFTRIGDPLRRPGDLLSTVRSPVGTLADKLRVLRLGARVRTSGGAGVWAERSTAERLQAAGFSSGMVRTFFRPFLAGVFLEPELETSAAFFEFVFRMFATGAAALPAAGMEAIPRQLAAQLSPGSVRTRAPVRALGRGAVELESGERIQADAVVVAIPGPAGTALLPERPAGRWRSVTCLYFSAPEPPELEPLLILNGTGRGPVNNLCVADRVAPAYAPSGRSLISATVLGTHADEEALWSIVETQLREWYGSQTERWERLRSYAVAHALPASTPGLSAPIPARVPGRRRTYVAGDQTVQPSIEGAVRSGLRAARSVLADLRA